MPDERPAALELLGWFDHQGRSQLPWRHTRDPWSVLVAEVMLQQTQVARVIPAYHAFLTRFPTPAACAAAPAAAVIEAWHGLGYNRRALNLWRASGVSVERFEGEVPLELGDLLSLPGVGPYTARAVLAFAAELDVGVLDTNVARVLARTEGRCLGRAEAQRLADGAVPKGHGWAWNQAMIDVGATVCSAKGPACERCPLRLNCRWHGQGHPHPDPAIGSAGVSGGQSTFAGSDRQGRGRLVGALRQGPVANVALAAVMGWPNDLCRAERVAATVVADGLAQLTEGRYRLPS